jgi:hypothetical protein
MVLVLVLVPVRVRAQVSARGLVPVLVPGQVPT